jgi:hypothetical protein
MKKEDFLKLGFSEEDAKKAAEASAEELKSYIPKARFDEVNDEKKKLETTVVERDQQLEILKNSTGDVETMKKQITDLQADNKKKDETHAAEIKQLKRDSIDGSLLLELKAKNNTAVKALLEKIDDSADEETYKTMRTEQIKKLLEADDTKFLFDTETKKPKMKGAAPGETGKEDIDNKVDVSKMSYEEIATYLEENPDAEI